MATFIATAGNDVFNGTEGVSDTVDYSGASGRVIINLDQTGFQRTFGSGDDSFISIENIIGSGYADYIYALAGGTHSFFMGAGDDTINVGGEGVWTVDGGGGLDLFTVRLDNTTQDWTFNYDGQTGSGTLTGGTVLTSIERLGITFGSGNDTINIAHNMGIAGYQDSTINCWWGSDTVNITDYNGVNNVVYGGVNPAGGAPENDTLNLTLSDTHAYSSSITADTFSNSFSLEFIANTGSFHSSEFEHVNFLLDDGDNSVEVGSLPNFDGTLSLHVDAAGGKDSLTMNLYSTNTETKNVVWTVTGFVTTQSNIGYFDHFETIDLHLGGGANLLHMGDETDTIYSMAGQDTIYGGGGNDIIEALFSNRPVQNVVYHGGDGADYLAGNSGDDSLYGDAGSDTIDGGAGNDVAVFASGLSEEKVFGFAGDIWVYDKASHDLDKLSNIETLQFADRTITAAQASAGSFNGEEYVASNPDLLEAFGSNVQAATQHFISYGQSEGRAIDSFNAEEYLASNADLLEAFGTDTAAALDHYVNYGYGEHRATTSFNAEEYLASHQDLLNAFGGNAQLALDHYVQYGYDEHRATASFNAEEYLASNPDLLAAFGSNVQLALDYYVQYGYGEHRPTASFNAEEYLASNPDLLAIFGSNTQLALDHYIYSGYGEHRPTTSFDVTEYIASNPDLITALGANTQAGLYHYTHYGYDEHRATTSFDAAQYIANYPDLAAAFGHDLHAAELHYILYGYAEHRTDHAF